MTPLLELAACVEALDGPCRQMDAEIAVILQMPLPNCADWLKNKTLGIVGTNGRVCELQTGVSWASQYFTESIDAAMTLVPDGFWIKYMSQHVNSDDIIDGKKSYCFWVCNIEKKYSEIPEQKTSRGCATLPLAITAAALRARAYEERKT